MNGTELSYVENELDLGVIVTTKLNWEENILALCTKASSRLGLMKRTLHFIKDSKQKRAFYLALVRSIFEHCSVIWKPSTVQLTHKIESIQRKAVKWILGEHFHHYNDYEYLMRLKDLDLMPMEYKFKYSDLVMFHKIYHGKSVIKLPQYLVPITHNDRSRLRLNIHPPERYSQSSPSDMPDLASKRLNRLDSTSFKCVIGAKTNSFKGSFFFRTHIEWNHLPVSIRELSSNDFQTGLKQHLWEVILDPP